MVYTAAWAALALLAVASSAAELDCPAGTAPHSEIRIRRALEWCEDRRHRVVGPFRALHADGSVAIQGRIHADGCPEGEWHARYENGKPAWRGAFGGTQRLPGSCWTSGFPTHPEAGPPETRGVKEGRWEIWYDDGTLREVASYRNGRLHGSLERWGPDGKRLERSFHEDGPPQGTYERWHGTGGLREQGEYANGERVGLWKRFHPNGQQSEEGRYAANKPSGLWKTWHPNGNLASETEYEAGRFTGERRTWHPNGVLAERAHFENTKRHGTWQSWHEDGVLRLEEEYDHGRRVRVVTDNTTHDPRAPSGNTASILDLLASGERWTWSFRDGCPAHQRRVEQHTVARWTATGCIDKQGRRQGRWVGHYRADRPRFERSYLDGQLQGIARDWWESGKLDVEMSYERGVPHGSVQSWHYFGQPSRQGRWEHGRPVGTWRSWYENGVPEQEIEIGAAGSLLRWQKWNTRAEFVEAGSAVAGGRFHVSEFLARWGIPDTELLSASARIVGARDLLRSGEEIQWPQVDVERSGPALERTPEGTVCSRGQYSGGQRDGEWMHFIHGRTWLKTYRGGKVTADSSDRPLLHRARRPAPASPAPATSHSPSAESY